MHVKDKWIQNGAGHVVDDDVRLRSKSFEELVQPKAARRCFRVLNTYAGPEKQMAPAILQFLQSFDRASQHKAIGINQSQINIYEYIPVLHRFIVSMPQMPAYLA